MGYRPCLLNRIEIGDDHRDQNGRAARFLDRQQAEVHAARLARHCSIQRALSAS